MRIKTTQPRLHTDEQIEQFHHEGWYGQRLLVDHLDEQAEKAPDKIAIVEAHRSLSYREVVRLSENLAASLLQLGVTKGDVVAIIAPNWAELPIVHFATDRIGAIFLPLSSGFREKELLHLLGQSRARVLFCPQQFHGFSHLELVQRLRGSLPMLQHVVALRDDGAGADGAFDAMSNAEEWRTAEGEQRLRAARAHPDEPSHVMVSSGTTGMPRCSLFSDNNTLVKLLQQYVPAAKVGSADVAAALAPAGTGATGYNYPILSMLLLGGTSVMLEHWSGSQIDKTLELIERNACSMAVMVPAQLTSLVQAAERTGYRHPLRLITNSGAKLPSSVAQAAERAFGCKVQSIYGSSEAGATAMTRVDDAEEKRRFTVGRPLSGQDVSIVADDGTSLDPGEVGEVCWRGANKSYGFLQDSESTEKVWGRQGWLHSGDLGLIDAEGYLQIVGRKKDMIIRGGQNINPGAIEELLLSHPDVAEIAIVPIEDPILGERIAACVVARTGASPTLDSLKSFVLANGLAAWHQPELLLEVKELPRNAGGKVDKKALSRSAAIAREAGR
jgi:non-ribosomal peptide synthetase component E (peptide arylation enzyme)